jgi:hypothetical protein
MKGILTLGGQGENSNIQLEERNEGRKEGRKKESRRNSTL